MVFNNKNQVTPTPPAFRKVLSRNPSVARIHPFFLSQQSSSSSSLFQSDSSTRITPTTAEHSNTPTTTTNNTTTHLHTPASSSSSSTSTSDPHDSMDEFVQTPPGMEDLRRTSRPTSIGRSKTWGLDMSDMPNVMHPIWLWFNGMDEETLFWARQLHKRRLGSTPGLLVTLLIMWLPSLNQSLTGRSPPLGEYRRIFVLIYTGILILWLLFNSAITAKIDQLLNRWTKLKNRNSRKNAAPHNPARKTHIHTAHTHERMGQSNSSSFMESPLQTINHGSDDNSLDHSVSFLSSSHQPPPFFFGFFFSTVKNAFHSIFPLHS
eukprot:TRINITY_DN2249_c0_g2_i1.p1 TRINITY_DN2249_c0_g2~~TRINITY_DN2249_c0_g2_i1.p1  ORF type:complete len:320 (-),score=46.77 TRINITY_DN2249_c0_g2_i1:1124-2083(-)